MKIQIIISSLRGGGAERVACNLAEGWARRGHSVCVTTIGSTKDDFYTLGDGIKRISLNSQMPSTSLLRSVKLNLKRFFSLRDAIKSEQPGVVVALMTTTCILTIVASIGVKVPVVVAEHSYPPRSVTNIFWKAMRKHLYRFASCVVALTDESSEWLENHTSASRVITIPNALVWPLRQNDPHISTSSLSPDRHRFIAVGRLHPVKAFDRLLHSFSLIVEQLPSWDLVIVGNGEQSTSLSTLTKELNISDRVIFPGTVGNVSDWYQQSDVFVLSSDNEGFPGALLEAMASGLCVVAVDCKTGPKDIISHKVDGLLCAVNADELSKQMLIAASNPDLRIKMADKAMGVIDTYSNAAILDLWDKLFKSLSILR